MDTSSRHITTGNDDYNTSDTDVVYNTFCDVYKTLYGPSLDFLEWYIPLVVVSITAIVANILTIAATVLSPQGKTAHAKLIISLAVSDCYIAILFLVDDTLCYTNVRQSFWHVDVFLCYTVIRGFLYCSSVLATLLNLLALAVDHYVAIVNPLHYNRIMTSFRTKLLILVIWIISLLVGSLETAIDLLTHLDHKPHVCDYAEFTYSYIVPYIFVMLEVFILIVLYTKVFLEYKRFVARRQIFQLDDQHNKKAIVTTSLIIGSFMLCWIPMSVYEIVVFIFYDYYPLDRALLLVDMLMLMNTLCDPIIYGLRLPVVRHGYRIMFRKLWRQEHSSDASLGRNISSSSELK